VLRGKGRAILWRNDMTGRIRPTTYQVQIRILEVIVQELSVTIKDIDPYILIRSQEVKICSILLKWR
jgi:hypothetical protein